MTALDNFLVPALRSPRWFGVATLVCLLAAGGAAREYLAAENQAVQLRREAARLQVPAPAKPRLSKAEEERKEHWKSLANERAFNWYPVFKALERASSDDIELLEFQPDKTNGQLVLRGEARNMDALVSYLERLSGQDIVGRAYITHQKSAARESLRTVAFEIKSSLKFNNQ